MSACSSGDPGSIPGFGRTPGEGKLATHSSTLAGKIPWTKEPGRLQSMGHKELDTTDGLHFVSFFDIVVIGLVFLLPSCFSHFIKGTKHLVDVWQ